MRAGLVEIRATEKVAAGPADQFAATVFETGGTGGAEPAMVLAVERALLSCWLFCRRLWSGNGLHGKRVAQIAVYGDSRSGAGSIE